jgi:hypothetical protein
MGLEKAIASGKEYRKPYKGAKSFDKGCRNHGFCSKCRDNKLYATTKELEKVKYQEDKD